MFKFKYKRKWLWHSYMVTGFKPDHQTDRMAIFFPDGGILEIPQWSKCHCRLGSDFFAFQHKKMESEAGQSIPLKNVNHK